MLLIAQQKKFRPKTVIGLDLDRKARHLAGLVSLPDALAARTLVVYHLAEQRAMMGAFLDALGIAHEDGLIQEDDVKPDPEKLATAAAGDRRQRIRREDVALYLNTLLCQDPQTWGGLEGLPELGSWSRPGLRTGLRAQGSGLRQGGGRLRTSCRARGWSRTSRCRRASLAMP